MKTIKEAADDLLKNGDWDYTQPNWCGADALELNTEEKQQYAEQMKLELQAILEEPNRYPLPTEIEDDFDVDEFVQEKAQSVAESFVIG